MTQIKLRRDTETNWATANSVLSQGEPGLNSTTNSLKIGDGTTHWTDLQYIVPPLPPMPHIEYTGVVGSFLEFWRYSSSFPKLQYSSTGEFRTTGDGLYWLDQNFNDYDYDLSGTTSLHLRNIGGITGYLRVSSKAEVVMTTLDLGELAVVDEYVNIGGFSNTLVHFYANNLVDIGGNFEMYGNQTVNGIVMNYPALDRVTGNFYIDYNNGNSDYFLNTPAPRFPALTYVGSGMQIYNNSFTSWTDFTSLRNITYDFRFYQNTNNDNALFDGPGMPALTRIKYGNLYYNSNIGMQHISEFAALTRIDGCAYIYENPNLTSFPSFPVLTYVAGVYAYNNTSMTSLDGANSPGGWLPSILFMDGEVNFRSCALDQTSVDDILLKLSILDGTNGTISYNNRNIYIDQGTNAIPSQTGLDAIAVLQARGCNVSVNS